MKTVQHSQTTQVTKERVVAIDCADLLSFLRENGVPIPGAIIGIGIDLVKEDRRILKISWTENSEENGVK